jgi:hypothetical protein
LQTAAEQIDVPTAGRRCGHPNNGLQPNLATARRAILRELSKIAGFSQTGRNPFCGLNSYRALIEEVAKRTTGSR